jgi:wyosine [tRNA(Phe)-imidazoG37] synthetase (radical SAM superfamily)
VKTRNPAPAQKGNHLTGRNVRIFGPVPSRRLGFSLGVDLIPYKTCTLDCLYCQLGPTARTTVARKSYAPAAEVLRHLGAALKKGGAVDWITFSGSGEPTLHTGMGKMIRAVKQMTRVPVAVITNGTLLADPRVRRALREADLVLPDLDAGSARVFRKINRPHPSLRFSRVVAGITRFAREFRGRVWIEVVLLKGVNDTPEELKRIGALAAAIRPERVQLNTAARPPAYADAKPLSHTELRAARDIIAGTLAGIPVDIIADFKGTRTARRRGGVEDTIIAYLARRPGTERDLAAGLGIRNEKIAGPLDGLVRSGSVKKRAFRGEQYSHAAGKTYSPRGER